jgi:hypothetical protein
VCLVCLQNLAERFRVPLEQSGFNADSRTLLKELQALKNTVRHYYDGVPVNELWKNVLRYRRHEFPNLSLLADVVLSIAVSNDFVESAHGFLTTALLQRDRKLTKKRDVTNDLFVIRANHVNWSDTEREDIIEQALNAVECDVHRAQWPDVDGTGDGEPPAKRAVLIDGRSNRDAEADNGRCDIEDGDSDDRSSCCSEDDDAYEFMLAESNLMSLLDAELDCETAEDAYG